MTGGQDGAVVSGQDQNRRRQHRISKLSINNSIKHSTMKDI
jgi:hypothetical protein